MERAQLETPGEDTLYSLTEMAELLKKMHNPPIIVSRKLLQSWTLKGLKYSDGGGRKRITLRDLREWLSS